MDLSNVEDLAERPKVPLSLAAGRACLQEPQFDQNADGQFTRRFRAAQRVEGLAKQSQTKRTTAAKRSTASVHVVQLQLC